MPPLTVVGLDLGGTYVKALVLDPAGRVLAEETLATAEGDGARWQENVRTVYDRLSAQHFPTVAGLCAPGLPRRDERAIAHMPGRLVGIENFVWSEFLGVPTIVMNDAQAALLGEVWQGAAREAENVVMLTLGTGVGGAAMVDGCILRGHLGRAGHLGHIPLNPDGAPDIVGTPGSLEDAIGDCTLRVRSKGRFADTRALVAAVAADDSAARHVWDKSVRALAAAIAGLINVLDPETIVVGGGIARAGELLFAPLRAHLDAMEWRPTGRPVAIVPAMLGARAGAFGAARRALEAFSA